MKFILVHFFSSTRFASACFRHGGNTWVTRVCVCVTLKHVCEFHGEREFMCHSYNTNIPLSCVDSTFTVSYRGCVYNARVCRVCMHQTSWQWAYVAPRFTSSFYVIRVNECDFREKIHHLNYVAWILNTAKMLMVFGIHYIVGRYKYWPYNWIFL